MRATEIDEHMREVGTWVNHGTLEEWGMVNLSTYLRERWPGSPVHPLPQGSRVRTAVLPA